MNEENNKSKIIPSYLKNGANKTNEQIKQDKNPKVKKEKNDRKVKSKITFIVIVFVAIILIVLAGLGIYKVIELFRFNKYNTYSERMERYALAELYNDEEATSSEYVTKSEAIKVIIGSILNKSDILEYMNYTDLIDENEFDEDANESEYTEDSNEYVEKFKNSMWVEYATSMGIITEKDITVNNFNEPIKYIEALKYVTKAKEILLRVKNISTETAKFKDINIYTVEEQSSITDLVSTGIIENSSKKLNGNKILHKGELNQILINLVEKNSLITINGDKINVNKDKEPSNASNYPYILSNVDKTVYEKEDIVINKDKYRNAVESFSDIKGQYLQIDEIVKNYFNTILNIDYSALTEDKINEIQENLKVMDNYYSEMDNLNEYIEYVKSNSIKISGTVKTQMPCVYFDGENYRVRVKITYTIENASEMKNILYKDFTSEKDNTYTNQKQEKIIDVKLSKSTSSDSMYVIALPISEL